MTSPAIRLLIADDDADTRDLLSHQLKRDDFVLDIHETAESALHALNDNAKEYDVILLDLKMPGMSGLDCLRTIKSNEKLRHLPVILQTCDNDVSVISEALKAGAYYFLEKTTEKQLLFCGFFQDIISPGFSGHCNDRAIIVTGLQDEGKMMQLVG